MTKIQVLKITMLFIFVICIIAKSIARDEMQSQLSVEIFLCFCTYVILLAIEK